MTIPIPTDIQGGSRQYLTLLADAASKAEHATTHDDAEMWYAYDRAWESVTGNPTPNALSYFATVGLALLHRLTGTSVPRLAVDAMTLHIDKNAGYAGIGNPDPWANFRLASHFGVHPYDGVLVRLSDKYIRTQNLRRNPANERVGESLIDTVSDSVAYALIARCIAEEDDWLS